MSVERQQYQGLRPFTRGWDVISRLAVAPSTADQA
jgi:hypothetical protein